MMYVVEYVSAADTGEKAKRLFPSHRARWAAFRDRGELLLIGTFSDLTGAMGVFTTRLSAEEFVAGDPFVLEGVVASYTIREWNEVLSESWGLEAGAGPPQGGQRSL